MLRALAVVAACTQLSGCFFVFIPGSLMKSAGDAITGAKGDHCVSAAAQVGDKIAGPDGRQMQIKSLSGTSTYCREEARPVRAELSPA